MGTRSTSPEIQVLPIQYKFATATINLQVIAFSAIQDYNDTKVDPERLQKLIAPAIMYQRMLNKATEIFSNDIVVDRYATDNGLSAVIRSFAVFDYLKAKLGTGEGVGCIKNYHSK